MRIAIAALVTVLLTGQALAQSPPPEPPEDGQFVCVNSQGMATILPVEVAVTERRLLRRLAGECGKPWFILPQEDRPFMPRRIWKMSL